MATAPASRRGPDIAAHLLFQGLRAVMVIGAISRPDLVSDARMRAEMVRLMVDEDTGAAFHLSLHADLGGGACRAAAFRPRVVTVGIRNPAR